MDDLKVRDIEPESLYKIMSIIHQNVFIFDTTIKENITLYQHYGEEDIKKAIQRSGLVQFVDSSKNKENTYIGEAGNRLSGGEKQRIAIARALVKNTPVLLLDEATASLDNIMAYEIEKSILDLQEITAVVVTHKLSEELLQQYDCILVMRHGRLVEIGTFQQLIEQKKYFYGLFFNENTGVENKSVVNI